MRDDVCIIVCVTIYDIICTLVCILVLICVGRHIGIILGHLLLEQSIHTRQCMLVIRLYTKKRYAESMKALLLRYGLQLKTLLLWLKNTIQRRCLFINSIFRCPPPQIRVKESGTHRCWNVRSVFLPDSQGINEQGEWSLLHQKLKLVACEFVHVQSIYSNYHVACFYSMGFGPCTLAYPLDDQGVRWQCAERQAKLLDITACNVFHGGPD
mmetsp:Transcript_11098/g.20782  ORF Transcript_11098/g.20782 Transcript_11098/m.20782 type:complete len:211 (+) Transcript_11098:525-1157(+)